MLKESSRCCCTGRDFCLLWLFFFKQGFQYKSFFLDCGEDKSVMIKYMRMPLEEKCIPELDYEIKLHSLKECPQTGNSSRFKVGLLVCFFSWVVKGSPSGSQQVFEYLLLFFSPVVSDVVFSPRSQKCSVEPQLSEPQSPLSLTHRSLPTSSSCYCGQSSSLVLPTTAPLPVLEWGQWIGI